MVWKAKSCHVCINCYLFSEKHLFAIYSFLLLQKELLMFHFVYILNWDAKWKTKFVLKMHIWEIIKHLKKFPSAHFRSLFFSLNLKIIKFRCDKDFVNFCFSIPREKVGVLITITIFCVGIYHGPITFQHKTCSFLPRAPKAIF